MLLFTDLCFRFFYIYGPHFACVVNIWIKKRVEDEFKLIEGRNFVKKKQKKTDVGV